MPSPEQHVAMVETFMRSWDYVPTPYDVRGHLIEHGVSPAEAEAAIEAWEAKLESEEEG